MITLSVVIPSYNRGKYLLSLFDDVQYLAEKYSDVEFVILDNASTDIIYNDLKCKIACGTISNIRFIANSVNLGMEGNICKAILSGNGIYTWLMSDHQRFSIGKFDEIIQSLRNGYIDFAYVSPREWDPPCQEIKDKWGVLSKKLRGTFLFGVGNISTFIFKNSIARRSIKHVFNLCNLNYPHLGILCSMENESIVAFVNGGTSYQKLTGLQKEYHPLEASFSNHIIALEYVNKRSIIKFSKRFFSVDYYKKALIIEVAKNTCRNESYLELISILGKIIRVNSIFVLPLPLIALLFCISTPPRIRCRIMSPLYSALKERFR